MNRLWVRLTLAFIAITLVGATMIAVLVDWSASNQFRQYLARQDNLTQSGLLTELAAFYQQKGTWAGVSDVFANLATNRARGQGQGQGSGQGRGRPPMVLADATLRVVYDERDTRVGSLLSADERASAQLVTANGATLGYLLLDTAGRGALAPAEQNFLDQLRGTLIIAALVAGAIGVGLGLLISRTVAAPLSDLAQSARAFAAHDWERRVPVRGADEIAEVAREFNAMADELHQAETLRRNLIADIAHELRTPLTVLQGNLRAMLDDVYPLDHSEIATLYDESRLLNHLVDDLRELALADAGQLPLHLQPVNLDQVLRATVNNFAIAADTQNVRLVIQDFETFRVQADPDRLAQILRNLVSNALRHTPSGGQITIGSETQSQTLRVSVSDTGEGIAAEDLPHVFDRFYRGDKSRARGSGGTGLGLAIVKAWVEAMGGSVGVVSERGHGSRFWFTLPQSAQ